MKKGFIQTLKNIWSLEELREKIEYLIIPDFRYWQMSGEKEKKDFDTMNDEVK